MTQITINRVDNVVLQDGEAYPVDCKNLAAYVKVIQFDTEAGEGWIEFMPDFRGIAELNQKIIDFTPYNWLLVEWQRAKDEAAAGAPTA